MDCRLCSVSPCLPSLHLSFQHGRIFHAFLQALPFENGQFNLRHVQPACMRRGVVELDMGKNALCGLFAVCSIERFFKMRIEIITNNVDFFRTGKAGFYQVRDE